MQKIDQENSAPEIVNRYWDKLIKEFPKDKELERHGKEALEWFRKTISKSKYDANKIIRGNHKYQKLTKLDRTMIGNMFLFEYKAEQAGHSELPIYDKFPLIWPFNIVKKNGHTYVYGINVHYLPPLGRAKLYQAVMRLKKSKKWNDDVKIKMTYDMLKAVAAHKLLEQTVHAYRLDRLQSKMIRIAPNDYIVCTFLQIQKFIEIEDHTPSYSFRQKQLYKKNTHK